MESSLSAFTSAAVISASAHIVDLRPAKLNLRLNLFDFIEKKGREEEDLNSPQGRPRG